ncbi:MAG: hypothetical protein CMJ29_07315 [Phycisphaerae bacterium]|nr:hypothetical protein [Phycisphaerae bacterium]|tara:strand:- start:265 stop:840 length:576 start_codon:yes stop_codon:yes gene_type:complete
MTKLIARLIMATMLFPLGVIVFIAMIAVASTFTRGPSSLTFLLIWFVEYLFTGVYWIMLWKPIVKWTPQRVSLTGLVAIISLAIGFVFMGIILAFTRDLEPAIALGGLAPPVSFLLLTIWVWQEREDERLERLSRAEGIPIECPGCQYDMRGLKTTLCPECGSSPTLHQLYAGQKSHDAYEISQHEEGPNP